MPVVARPPGAPERTDLTGRKTTVLLPIASDDAASRRAIVYALGLGASDVRGLHIALGDDDAEKAKAAWAKRAMPIPVDVVASPYRDLGGPLLDAIRAVTADPDAVCVIVLPEIISPHRWQRVLHNQRGLFIKRLLLFEERVILASVPYRVPTGPLAAPSRARGGSRRPSTRRAAGIRSIRTRRSASRHDGAPRAPSRSRDRPSRRSRASRPRRCGGSSRASPARSHCSR